MAPEINDYIFSDKCLLEMLSIIIYIWETNKKWKSIVKLSFPDPIIIETQVKIDAGWLMKLQCLKDHIIHFQRNNQFRVIKYFKQERCLDIETSIKRERERYFDNHA